MRTNIFALPLLAFGGGVLASRCSHRPSSALSVSTTPTLSTASTESTPVLTPTTPTATPSISSTESSSESTTPSVSLSTPSTLSTPSVSTPSTESTSSAESTPSTVSTPATESTVSTSSIVSTPSAEPTSTEPTPSTTSTPEPTPSTESTTLFTSTSTASSTAQATTTAAPQLPNLLTNPGFEDSTLAPWALFRPTINRGQISIATDPVYEGSQSGNFHYAAGLNSGSAIWGIYQSVDGSGLVADDPYQITLRLRVAPGTCSNVFVGGTSGSDARLTAGQVTVDVAAASVGWIQVTTVVRYNQVTLSQRPGVAIMAMCRDAVSIWVDNVALRKAT